MGWTKMIDLELDDEDQLDFAIPSIAEKPRYPWGMRISLDDHVLDKAGLDADCEVGDVIDMRAFAVVTAVSINEMEGGKRCRRVELQIQKIAVENEADEDEENED